MKLLKCESEKFTGKFLPQPKVSMKNDFVVDIEIQFSFNKFNQKKDKKGFVLSFLLCLSLSFFQFFCVTHIQRSSGHGVRQELSKKKQRKSKYTTTKIPFGDAAASVLFPKECHLISVA